MNGEGTAKALWVLFFVVLCWPFVGAADAAGSIFGIPALIVYTFSAWAVLVAALAAVSRGMED